MGTVPKVWGKSLVFHLFKSNPHFDPHDYRPDSLTFVCCKSMARIVVSQLADGLKENNLQSLHQYMDFEGAAAPRTRCFRPMMMLTVRMIMVLLWILYCLTLAKYLTLWNMRCCWLGLSHRASVAHYLPGFEHECLSVCDDGASSPPVDLPTGVTQGLCA